MNETAQPPLLGGYDSDEEEAISAHTKTTVRLLATGDQHFGAGADLGHKPGDRLAEQEAIWAWTLGQARARCVDAIVHAGDVFQHRRPDPETLLAFERPLIDHHEHGGPHVLVIVGNHDIAALDTGCALDVFDEAGLIELVRAPRVVLVDGGAWVACLPWAPTARLAANYDGPRDELNQHASSLLIDAARDLFAQAMHEMRSGPGRWQKPFVLLTHFSISGTSLPSGLDVGQLREPVLPQDELLDIGYDAIVAGHIHFPQTFGDTGLYVGSPGPLNFGEADGRTRGPWLVTLAPDTPARFEQLPANGRRFINLDGDPLQLAEGLPAANIDGAFVKLRIRGNEQDARRLDLPALKVALEDAGAYRAFVELDVARERRARDASVDDSLAHDQALEKWLASQNGLVDHDVAARALQRARTYFEQVGA